MIKIFDRNSIIKVEDYYVVVDKEAKILKGDKFISTNKRTSLQGIILTCVAINHLYEICCDKNPNPERGWHKSNVAKIICSIGQRIEGVPLIEEVDEPMRVANMALYGAFPNATREEGKLYREIYANGYRTAQSKFQGRITSITIEITGNQWIAKEITYEK